MVEDAITRHTAPGSSLASLLPSWSSPRKVRLRAHEFPSELLRGAPVVEQRKTRSKLHLILLWRHRSLRGPVDSVHKWLPDVLMSSQALQATPEIVGHNTTGPHQRTQQLSSLWSLGKLSARHAAPVIEHRKCQHQPDRVLVKCRKNSRSSRQPSSLNSTPLAMDCLHKTVNEVEHSSMKKPNGDHHANLITRWPLETGAPWSSVAMSAKLSMRKEEPEGASSKIHGE